MVLETEEASDGNKGDMDSKTINSRAIEGGKFPTYCIKYKSSRLKMF